MGEGFRLGGMVLGLAALTWALMSVLVKKIPPECSLLVVTAYAILTATIAMTPLALLQVEPEHFARLPSRLFFSASCISALYRRLGLFIFGIGGLQLVDAGSAGCTFFFQPLVGTLLGWLLLGEQVGWSFWLVGLHDRPLAYCWSLKNNS